MTDVTNGYQHSTFEDGGLPCIIRQHLSPFVRIAHVRIRLCQCNHFAIHYPLWIRLSSSFSNNGDK